MGNSPLTCFRGRGKVRVVLLNGDVAEFKEPVRASIVMQKYPRHVVLHCRLPCNRKTGLCRTISVLGPEQALKKNEDYLLTPIQSTKNNKPFLDSWAFFSVSAAYNKKLHAKIRRKSCPHRRWWIQAFFDKIFKTLPSQDEEATKLLVGLDRRSNDSKGRDDLSDWRPSLACIPESPTHSSHSAHLSGSSSFAGYPRLDFR